MTFLPQRDVTLWPTVNITVTIHVYVWKYLENMCLTIFL